MLSRRSGEAAQLLTDLGNGNRSAASQLLPLVYDELRAVAASYLQLERSDHTLQPTALVHEAYLRLVQSGIVGWSGRAHFFAVAAEAIRRVLIDHARKRNTTKSGGGKQKLTLNERLVPHEHRDIDVLALDDALCKLTTLHGRPGKVVELRFFGGLSVAEVARVLGVSRKTAANDWKFARAWLSNELSKEDAR